MKYTREYRISILVYRFIEKVYPVDSPCTTSRSRVRYRETESRVKKLGRRLSPFAGFARRILIKMVCIKRREGKYRRKFYSPSNGLVGAKP